MKRLWSISFLSCRYKSRMNFLNISSHTLGVMTHTSYFGGKSSVSPLFFFWHLNFCFLKPLCWIFIHIKLANWLSLKWLDFTMRPISCFPHNGSGKLWHWQLHYCLMPVTSLYEMAEVHLQVLVTNILSFFLPQRLYTYFYYLQKTTSDCHNVMEFQWYVLQIEEL